MNILFFLRSIGVGYGGIEVVSITLANHFHKMGHKVCICALYHGGSNIDERINDGIPLFIGKGNKYSKENVAFVRNIIEEYNIDFVINQMALQYIPIRILKAASRNLSVKIISVYHNAPNANGKLQKVDGKLAINKNRVYRYLLLFLRSFLVKATSNAMKYNYRYCDKYLVLSDSYIKIFQEFTELTDTSKLGAMTNPVTIECGSFVFDASRKQKEIIYVGRLDVVQKRVYRIIDTWKLIENKYPDWNLTIVGDGEDRKNLEQKVDSLNLNHVTFEGFKKPNEYYKRASVLVLTSDFEGFPLVLAEAMSFGIVPVVYDSFSAVCDIIKNGENGFIVPKMDGAFSAEAMAKPLEELMTDTSKLSSMARSAMEESKNYRIDTIYERWIRLFLNLKSEQ